MSLVAKVIITIRIIQRNILLNRAPLGRTDGPTFGLRSCAKLRFGEGVRNRHAMRVRSPDIEAA